MLFSRKIAPSCSYCRRGSNIGNGEVACIKRGITSSNGACKRYAYDPLKREPELPHYFDKAKALEALNEEDFVI